MYETLNWSTFEHRSVTETEYDRMSARARRPPPSSPLETEKRVKEWVMHNIIFKSTKKTIK